MAAKKQTPKTATLITAAQVDVDDLIAQHEAGLLPPVDEWARIVGIPERHADVITLEIEDEWEGRRRVSGSTSQVLWRLEA